MYLQIADYIIPFLFAFSVAMIVTRIVRWIATRWNIMDRPDLYPERKIQGQPVPLLGGVAVFVSFTLVMIFYALFTDRLLGGYMLPKYLVGIIIGGILLMVGGYLDDRYNLRWNKQIVWPILASLVIIASGIGVSYITNPFGGTLRLDAVSFTVFNFDGLPYRIILIADLFAFFWLIGMMYTTKFLDGLDGLVAGVTTIAAFIIFFLSLNKEVAQPETALLAALLAGTCFGFLLFNFHPAKIFLGEGGSLWAGFMLAVLAIISGSKIATALLIMGIPILDVLWVIMRRLFGRRSPFLADRKHLHFRLLDIGFSHRSAVLLLYFLSLSFGVVALFLGSREKLVAFILLIAIMLILAVSLVILYRKKARIADDPGKS